MLNKEHMLSYAELIDAYRLIPRLLLIGYAYMLYSTTVWFMSLQEPLGSQSAVIATVWGAAAGITGFYNMTGRKWDKKQ